jgi:ABC-type Fe3+/spermidine/putrescine transport system ATPase subunit
LDEPFSNLDNIHKAQLKEVINDITGRLSTTCILVSHDAADILPWADDILVMKDGSIIQRGNAQEIYKYPQTTYTAALLGTFNLLSPALAAQLGLADDRNIIRPEELYYSIDNTDGIRATVKAIRYLGSYYELDAQINDEILTLLTQDTDIAIGTALYVHKR